MRVSVKVAGLACAGLVALSACGEETSGSTGPDGGPTVDVDGPVGPEGGTLSNDGATVTVPAGALSGEVMIEAARMDAAQISALPEATHEDFESAAALTDGVFVLTPHGTSFSVPAEVELAFTGEANVVLRLDDESDTSWEIVGDAVVEGGRARFTTSGFSIYAVASAMLNCQRQFCLSLASQSGGPECGLVDDNCGGQVDVIYDCGLPACGEGMGCSETNQCEAGCVSDFDCQTTTAECGMLVDSCGNERDVVAECDNKNGCGELGNCTNLNLCGACTPYADCAAALAAATQSCGPVSDGCGGTMDCNSVCTDGDECVYVKDAMAANGDGYHQCGTACTSDAQCPTGGSYCTENDEAWFEGWSCEGGICQGVGSQPEPCAQGCFVCGGGCSGGKCQPA